MMTGESGVRWLDTVLPSRFQQQGCVEPRGSQFNRWLWFGGLVVLLLTFAAHVRGLQGQFLEWDDYAHITQNPAIRSLAPANLWAMFTQPAAKLYCPMTWLSFAVDYQIWGRNPFGYHLTNLLLHVANAVLVMVLVYCVVAAKFTPNLSGRVRGSSPADREKVSRLQNASRVQIAILTAAIFGVHPLRVESVAWATERKDVLFAFFYLLALLAYLRWVVGARRTAYWTCLLLFICSALSKSAAVTFPLVLVLLDIFWKRRVAIWEKVPFVAVCVIIGAATFVAQASGTGETVWGTEAIPLWARAGLVGYCAFFYVGRFFWPIHLSPVYPAFEDFAWTPAIAAGWAAAFCAALVAAFALRKRAPIVWPSWLFYLATLSPTIGLIPVGAHVVADRYAYMAVLGLALPTSVGLVVLADRARGFRMAVGTATVVLLVVLTALSVRQSAVWSNTETLFRKALAEDPRCYTALVNLTIYYTSANRLDDAIACGNRAVDLAPNGLIGRKNLAVALVHANRYREAIQTLRPAVGHGIDDPAVWRLLAESFTALGEETNAKAAEAHLRGSPRGKP
jgi:hypothetical protein